MSTTVDNRVLEMRFDNAQFEKGVSTSMSTLDKLKQKLNLSGASKGLQDVGKAAKNVNFAGMNSGIETVQAKFSALQVAGVTALANITNSAVNAGKRMVSALTIDPIKTGFQEYETQINAVQTILANTQKEGTNVQIVNKALDELNTYADKTIYNFTEMTRNIGTFTAAGVKLDTSVKAIKGIANLAATSGSTSQQASTAMYQLSQALAAGKVSLMDWNSVVNAGMGGQVFQDALVRTSELLGTGAKNAIKMYGSFRESLTKGEWLTTEVLTETLNQFAGAYSEADLIAQGFTKEQAKEIAQMAKTAEEAATKVKTFTQLWDTMKEAAQSGWSQTWRILVGDFEEAKELFTGLSDFFNGIIGKSSDRRNSILTGALSGNPFSALADKIEKVTAPIEKMDKALGKVSETYNNLATEIIKGNWGNGEERVRRLTEAGYEWAHAQNIVNERLGDSTRHHSKLEESQKKNTKAQKEANKAQQVTIEQLVKMSDAQLKQLGFTKDEIEAFRELEDQSKKTGIPMKDLIKDIDQLNGRTLLINSFKNAGKGLVSVFEAVGKAWKDVFWNGASEDEIIAKKTETLYNAIAALHKFSTYLTPDKLPIDQITRSFKGLFAVIDIVATIAGGGLKIAFKVLSTILGAFDMNILDLTANIGDAIVTFRDFLFNNNAIAEAIDGLVSKLPGAVSQVKEWFNAFKETPVVREFITAIEAIQSAFDKFTSGKISLDELASKLGKNIADALMSIPDMMVQIGKDVIAGFQNGIEEGISGSIIGKIINFCTEFIASFASAMGCHSPSVKTHEIGVNTMQGFINGIKEMLEPVISVVKYIGEQIVNAFKFIWDLVTDESGNIEWDKLFAGSMLIGGLLMIKDFVDAMKGIADGISGIGDILENAGKVMKSFSKVLNGVAWDLKAKAIQKMAISIAILAGAVYVLAKIEDPTKLWIAVGVIGALAGIVLALAGAMELMSKASLTYEKGKLNIEGLKSSILQIGATLLMLGIVVKMIGGMKPEQAKQGFVGLTALMLEVIAFMGIVGLVTKGDAGKNIDKVGGLMLKLAIAMGLMAIVCKIVSTLSAEQMIQGGIFAVAFAAFVISIAKIAKTAGNNVSKVGGLMIKLAIAMGLMVGVCKLVSMLSAEEMIQGGIFAAAFTIFVKKLVDVTKIGKKQQIAKLGGLILSISVSLLLMVGVCKLVGTLSAEEMIKGGIFVAAFVIFVKKLVSILTVGSETEMVKVGATILAMSVSIGILAGVCALLGMLDIGKLAKGLTAVGLLGGLLTLMIKSLKGAQNVQKSIMMMAVTIGVMAIAVTALSLIDTADLAAATIALGTLMGMFALMTNSLKGLKSPPIAPIITLTVVVGLLAGVIFALRNVEPTSAIGSAIALSALLLAMAGTMKILDMMTKTTGKALLGILALSAMVIPLFLFVQVLKQMNGIDSAKENIITLIGLMTAMTLLLGVLTIVGHFWIGAAAGIIALTAMAIPMFVFIEMIKKMNGVENATTNVMLLIALMSTMTNLLVKISLVAPLAVLGVAAMAGLTLLMGAIGTMAVAVGAIMDKFPGIQKFLDIGLPVLEQLAGSIGTMIGKFIGGIGEGLGDSLVKIGQDIAAFMLALQVASINASMIKGESFNGVKQLMDVMGDIALTTVGTSISDIFTLGGTSMEKFQNDGVAFFEGMKKISEAANGCSFNEDSFNSVIKAAKKLADLQSSLEPIGGVLSWFTGRDDLAKFGDNIGDFFSSMKTAFESLEDVKVNEEALSAILNSTKKLANLQSSLEPIGGVISWFTGKDDLAKFGDNIGDFFNSMKTAFQSLDGVTVDEKALTSVIDSSTKLAKLQSSLEPMGGVIRWFTGRDDLAKFGSCVADFFGSMKTAFESLGDTTVDSEVLSSVIDASKKLAEFQSTLEPMGGVISWFTGRTDLGTFGEKIAVFGDAIGKLRDGLGEKGITQDAVASITNAGEAIIALQKALPEEGWFDGKMNLTQFSNYVTDFSAAMSSFGTTASGIDLGAVDSTISAANRIKSLIQSLVGLDTSGVAVFTGIGTGGFGADGAVSDIAKAIADFCNETSGIDAGVLSTSVSSALKLKNLISSLAGLDTSGIENFKIESIGTSISGYYNKVSGIDPGLVSSSISSANRLRNFITSLSGFDSSGVSSFKTAINELSTVNIQSFVDAFSSATTKLQTSGLNMINSLISGFKQGATRIPAMANFIINSTINSFSSKSKALTGAGISMMNGFATGLQSGKSKCLEIMSSLMSGLAVSVSGKSSIFIPAGVSMINGFATGLQSGTTKCITIVGSLMDTLSSSLRTKNSMFRASGVLLISGLTQGMQSERSKCINVVNQLVIYMYNKIKSSSSKFKSAGTSLMNGFVAGIKSQKASAQSAVASVVASSTNNIGKYYSTFRTYGSYVARGFADGIRSQISSAAAAAASMAASAASAAKKNLKINSPSKVFKKIGAGIPEGFVLGIKTFGSSVKRTVTGMTTKAVDSTQTAMSRMLDILNTDMNYEPSISPVIDLTNVKSGVGEINRMLSAEQTFGVRANLSSINSAMRYKNQNGSNSDVVSAINKLRKDLGNLERPSYNINGVTYDDGSNLAEAVNTIVRAARIERRV